MIEKSVKAPLTYNPSKGRPKEHLAYLNKGEMKALRLLNGNNIERGPSGLPSFPPADAAGSSSKASSTKSSSSVSRISGGTAGSNAARAAATKTTTRAPAASAAAAKASASKTSTASSAAKTALSGGGGARDSGQAANRPSSGSSVSRISGGVPGGNKEAADRRAYVNRQNAYVSNIGKNAGMAFNPMVMRGIGSYFIGGGPGAPKILASPGYESYYTDRKGNIIPVGNILSNNFRKNPVAQTGIQTLSGAGPVDYYRAAQSVEFRPIPKSELGQEVYGYMNPRISFDPNTGMYWDPKVVVDPTQKYALGGFSRPIPSPSGLGLGPISRGDFMTLEHELQHVGQYSHLLEPKTSEWTGNILDSSYVDAARKAYDPRLGNQGIENMNRELDRLNALRKGIGNPNFARDVQDFTNNYINWAAPTYPGSYSEELAKGAAEEMERESARMIMSGLRPEADRFTLQTLSRGAGDNSRYSPSSVRALVAEDLAMRGALSGLP
jgi:hypothetical protein